MTVRFGCAEDGLWAITSYFNPMCYRRRRENFRIFRERLNVPLVAVELSYGDEFELQEQDAEILIRLRGSAVLWQKERLLNVALRAVPRQCCKVAWIDCDVVFAAADWADSASALLDHRPIIQAFKHVHYLTQHWTPDRDCADDVEFTRVSAGFALASGMPPAASLGHTLDRREGTCATGFAWAARREVLDQHGFFDACILGGGDRAMVCAGTRCSDEFMQRHYMNERQRQRYITWAEPFYQSVKAETGFLDGDIFHLWHGDLRGRRTRARHEGLQPFQFDPFADIAADENGCWRWNTDKRAMHDYVRGYFAARREDG